MDPHEKAFRTQVLNNQSDLAFAIAELVKINKEMVLEIDSLKKELKNVRDKIDEKKK